MPSGDEPVLVPWREKGWGSNRETPLTTMLDNAVCSDPGAIISRDVDTWKCLEPGTAGYVLTTQGAGAPPAWTPGGTVVSVSFTSFGISGQSTPIEVGATIAAGSKTFTWSTSNDAAVQANSIGIVDTTSGTTLGSGMANNGSHALTISAITNTSPASNVWTITGTNTGGGTFSKTYAVNWYWRVYAGTDTSATLTANAIKALSDSSALQSGFAGTYTVTPSSEYSYFCYPDSMGSVSFFKDNNTGFPISMATATDNAAYSNTANGWSYALVSVTNAQGVATNYRVYRTQYSFTASLPMVVT